MNIFVLHQNPYEAARQHCDKHVVKMILEYGQLLSTAHRLLDGILHVATDEEGRVKPKKLWLLDGEDVCLKEEAGGMRWTVVNSRCYQVAHANHPCSVWARETDSNYHWLYQLFDGCLREYEGRYHRRHSASRIREFLSVAPKVIKRDQLTPFVQAMPNEYKNKDAVEAYRAFYIGSKVRFARWKTGNTPDWFRYATEKNHA